MGLVCIRVGLKWVCRNRYENGMSGLCLIPVRLVEMGLRIWTMGLLEMDLENGPSSVSIWAWCKLR